MSILAIGSKFTYKDKSNDDLSNVTFIFQKVNNV